jgi:hypothetical protein
MTHHKRPDKNWKQQTSDTIKKYGCSITINQKEEDAKNVLQKDRTV